MRTASITRNTGRFLSKQGQNRPRCYSKARQLSTHPSKMVYWETPVALIKKNIGTKQSINKETKIATTMKLHNGKHLAMFHQMKSSWNRKCKDLICVHLEDKLMQLVKCSTLEHTRIGRSYVVLLFIHFNGNLVWLVKCSAFVPSQSQQFPKTYSFQGKTTQFSSAIPPVRWGSRRWPPHLLPASLPSNSLLSSGFCRV